MPAQLTQKPLLGKFRLTSTLKVETGLHIGGGGENLDIGGLDKPVIRDPLTQFPYLPGSSMKGKLRSILERVLNKPINRHGGSGTYRYESDDLESGYSEVSRQLIPFEGARTCQVSRVFGSTGTNCWLPASILESQGIEADQNVARQTINKVEYVKVRGRNAPARLIVRDAHLTPVSATLLKKIDTGLFMTEWKFENGMDRITAAANPRQLERVPAGSEFSFELVYTVEDTQQATEDLKNLAIALAILEDDALGGHGSRGYGKVRFHNFQFTYRDIQQYRQMASGEAPTENIVIPDTAQLLTQFNDTIQALLPG